MSASNPRSWRWRHWYLSGAAMGAAMSVVGPIAVVGTVGCGERDFNCANDGAAVVRMPDAGDGATQDGKARLADASTGGVIA